MNFTKKFDRAFQWAGEKMGAEAKTSMSEDFRNLEMEMAVRYEGMDRLQKSMTAYVKWLGKRNEVFEDKEKGLPASYLGRTMSSHGEEFEPDSEFGNCLILLGRANERLAANQDRFVSNATGTWLESLDRSLAMMKEYQASRKKLENRRLAYDASIGKVQKAKREDFRVEEELRTCRAKYEESSEDVYRRMQDIKDAESDSIRDLTGLLDCELEYHERCLEELRRVKRSWPGAATAAAAAANGNSNSNGGFTGRSRSNTAQSLNADRVALSRTNSSFGITNMSNNSYVDEDPEPLPVRMPIRSNNRMNNSNASPEKPPRPVISRSSTLPDRRVASASGASTPNSMYGGIGGGPNPANTAAAAVSSLRSGLRPVGRIQTSGSYGSGNNNLFNDDGEDTASGGSGGRSGSPEWGDRSTSPATSYGSLSRSTSNVAVGTASATTGGPVSGRKPPPPPPNRAKKPPPPPVPRRETTFST